MRLPKGYVGAEKFVLFNEEDPNLDTIRVDLPECPRYQEIDGYGTPYQDQVFKRTVYPTRLKELEKSCSTLDEIYEKLEKHRSDYQKEIEFIAREWERRTNGYWFYNCGVPTYIDGWHYFYLNYWYLDNGLPDYRDRDRKFFYMARYCDTTTLAYYPFRVVKNGKPAYFSDEKEAIKFADEDYKVEEGEFVLDMGKRTILGFFYTKHRREGATYRAECILYEKVSRRYNVKGGIQSMTGTHAFIAFRDKLIKPWKKLPFFFKPTYDGSTSPVEKLTFDVPARKIGGKGSYINIETGLESEILWASSADGSTFDSDKFLVYHGDEFGKTTESNIDRRHQIIKRCLTQGNGSQINGLAIYTSTVGEMTKKGGTNALALAKKSKFSQRDNIGQTMSGLIIYFRPAYDGMEGFIDKFGNSVIEDPQEEDLWRLVTIMRDPAGKLIGAKRFLEQQRERWLDSEDFEAQEAYEEEVRLSPMSFDECFITAGQGTGFNLRKLNERIKILQFDDTATVRGNFEWKNGLRDTIVDFVPDKEGKFLVSLQLPDAQKSNKFTRAMTENGKTRNIWYPMRPNRFTASGDPYKFTKVEHTRLSKLGGAVFMERDKQVDPDEKDVNDWQTYRFVCTYSNRPATKEIGMEDMLMMCVYYGAMMFPEINVTSIWDYFADRGYSGYLKYERLPNGQFKKTPGFNSNEGNKQKLFEWHRDYIQNHAQREKHIEILREQKSIKGIEDMTNYDLFTAVGGCGLGSSGSDYGERMEELNNSDCDISDYLEAKRY